MARRRVTNVNKQLDTMRQRLQEFTGRDYVEKGTSSGYQLSFLFSGELQELIGKAFVANARRILASNPSAAQYVDNINYRIDGNGMCEIVVTDTEEGIMTYLEYGTGLLGAGEKHPEASGSGWQYAINEIRYVTMLNGNRGFVFYRQPDRYFNPQTDFMLTRRARDERRQVAFSQGIKPLRYLYNTRMLITKKYNQTRSLAGFIKQLEKIEGGFV